MILNAFYGHRWHNANGNLEAMAIFSEIMTSLRHEDASREWPGPGEVAWLSFSEQEITGMKGWNLSVNRLCVSVNVSTGYGALMWVPVDGDT